MTRLEPSPADLAALLVSMTEAEWPTSEADRETFFARLGLHDVDGLRSDERDPETASGRFTTDLSDVVDGSSTMFRREFLGLTLFCYDEQLENGAEAREGYDALRDQLSRRLGPTEEDWGSPTEPACGWRVGPLTLDVYCFQRLRSNIMISLDHAARSDAHDQAHADHEDADAGDLEP